MPSAFDDIPSAFDAHIDADGVPQFRHSCVLFWDVLGVKALSRDTDAHSHLVALSAALKRARARAGFETDAGQLHHAVTWFTDNVVIGSPVSSYDRLDQIEAALGYTAIGAAYLQLLLLDAGFLARGGIAFGEHHMQEDFVFGPALIDAAELADNVDNKNSPPRVALTPLAAHLNRAVVTEFYSSPEESPHAATCGSASGSGPRIP
jgi:hypothetical protein